MPGKSQKISIKLLHVDRHMGCALCSIHDNDRSHLMCPFADLLYGIPAAKDIGYLSHSYQLRSFADPLCQGFLCKGAILFTLKEMELCPCHPGCHLPWQEIAVMLHNGYGDLISRLQIGKAIAVCHKVQALCCISGKNDLFCVGCVQEITHVFSRLFIAFCRCKA